MKNFLAVIFSLSLLLSCKTVDNLSKKEETDLLSKKITATDYTFRAQTAIPMSGKSVPLDNSYTIKISKDTVDSYLPYFGRAYIAPMNPSEGGIKFISTNFAYNISDKKKGMWNVSIETKDTPTHYKIILNIGDSGYATLIVQETNKQSISFYGKIE